MEQSVLTSSDLEAIRRIHEAWIAAELSGDYDAVVALCTDDVRWLLPESRTVDGKDAGRRFLEEASVHLDKIETIDMRVEGTATLAYKTCRYETRFRDQDSLEKRLARGTHLWILRRVQGQWKVALVAWQSEWSSPSDERLA